MQLGRICGQLSLILLLLFAPVFYKKVACQTDDTEAPPATRQEECDFGQYFGAKDAKCHNCSELVRIFDPSHSPVSSWQLSSPEWQAASSKLQARGKPPFVGLVRLTQDKNNHRRWQQQQQLSEAARANRRNATAAELAPDAVLSRLIANANSDSTPLLVRDQSDAELGDEEHENNNEHKEQRSQAYTEREDQLALRRRSGSATVAMEDQYQEDHEDMGTMRFNQDPSAGPTSSPSSPLLLLLSFSSTNTIASLSEIAHSTRLQINILSHFISTSKQLEQTTLEAISECRQNQAPASCQQWSNLCTLTMYAHSSSDLGSGGPSSGVSSSSSGIGRLSRYRNRLASKQDFNSLNADGGIKTSWQNCPQFSLTSLCNSLRDWHRLEKPLNFDLASIYLDGASGSSDEDSLLENSDLSPKSTQIMMKLNGLIQLIAYKYSFDGQLLEVSQFDLHHFGGFACATLMQKSRATSLNPASQQLKVGYNYHYKCNINLMQIREFLVKSQRNLNETVFYDLFIGHSSSSSGAFIRPVPIVVKNLLYNNQMVNLKYSKDPSRWHLVRRFFFSAQTTIYIMDAIKQEWQEHLLFTFVRGANLELKFKKQQQQQQPERGGFLLSSIMLHLDYGQTVIKQETLSNWTSSGSEAKSAVQQIESLIYISQNLIDMQAHRRDLNLLIAILCILSCLWSLIKCYNIQKLVGVIKLDLYSLFVFIVLSCDIIGNLLALITLSYVMYLFLLFKLNTLFNTNNNDWQLLAPNAELEQALLFNIRLAFLLKLIGFAYKLYINLRVDLFFIDWEKPKMLTSMQILQHYHSSKNQAGGDRKERPNEITTNQEQQQISFWRSYTVINAWLQLLTKRRCNQSARLIALLCLLHSNSLLAQWTSVAPQQKSSGADNALDPLNSGTLLELSTSEVFRVLVLTLVYLGLAALQWAYKRWLHEPMIRSVTREFVDLCSVANVSLFAMLYPRYGYYVHGRNANGSGDCGLVEMNALLEREHKELCSRRGLAPNSDHQAFVMLLPRIINEHYRKLLMRYSYSESFLAGNFLKSALNLSHRSANLSITASGIGQSIIGSSTQASNRALSETIVARNRAINLFLTNFLEHIYRDIDYTIREPRRFEGLLMDALDADDADQQEASVNGRSLGPALVARNGGANTPTAPSSEYRATFCLDRSASSFTNLLLLGLELDLIVCELFCLLILDQCLGPASLPLTLGLLWLANKLFERFYLLCSRENLISKSMLDEKFLVRE